MSRPKKTELSKMKAAADKKIDKQMIKEQDKIEKSQKAALEENKNVLSKDEVKEILKAETETEKDSSEIIAETVDDETMEESEPVIESADEEVVEDEKEKQEEREKLMDVPRYNGYPAMWNGIEFE
jgi:hypothetical protein